MWDIVFRALLTIIFFWNIVTDRDTLEKIEIWLFILVGIAIRKL